MPLLSMPILFWYCFSSFACPHRILPYTCCTLSGQLVSSFVGFLRSPNISAALPSLPCPITHFLFFILARTILKVTGASFWHILDPWSANLSAFSLPYVPQWDDTQHKMVFWLMFCSRFLTTRIHSWVSLKSFELSDWTSDLLSVYIAYVFCPSWLLIHLIASMHATASRCCCGCWCTVECAVTTGCCCVVTD